MKVNKRRGGDTYGSTDASFVDCDVVWHPAFLDCDGRNSVLHVGEKLTGEKYEEGWFCRWIVLM